MLLVAAVALLAVTVPLAGGRLARLGDVRVHGAPWLLVALGLQVVASLVPVAAGWPGPALHVGSYACSGWFVVANRRLPGLPVLALGAALNLAAILANGGVMPASPAAVRAAGLDLGDGGFENSAPVAGARLALLGDVFALPEPWPLANVFSLGDVVLVVGAGVALHGLGGSRLARRRRGAPQPPGPPEPPGPPAPPPSSSSTTTPAAARRATPTGTT